MLTDGSKTLGGMKSGSTLGVTRRVNIARGALHDPEEEGAIVLFVPKVLTASEQLESLKSTSVLTKPPQVQVHVVIDPVLGKVLRPHQIEGVRFLYECVTGKASENCFGCIMADEMVFLYNYLTI